MQDNSDMRVIWQQTLWTNLLTKEAQGSLPELTFVSIEFQSCIVDFVQHSTEVGLMFSFWGSVDNYIIKVTLHTLEATVVIIF